MPKSDLFLIFLSHGAGFDVTAELLPQLALSMYPDGSPIVNHRIYRGWGHPASNMHSTSKDLTLLSQAIMAASSTSSGPLKITTKLAREMLDPVYWGPDGTTLFGTPWEMRTRQSYLVRSKGGNILGYTALISMVSELSLSTVIMWNGSQDVFKVIDGVHDILLPALVKALIPLQPEPNPGPSPKEYTGIYTSDVFHDSPVSVSILKGKLIWASMAIANFFLDWIEGDAFRAHIPQGRSPCITSQVSAVSNQTVLFTRNEKGEVTALSVFGVVQSMTWKKVGTIISAKEALGMAGDHQLTNVQ